MGQPAKDGRPHHYAAFLTGNLSENFMSVTIRQAFRDSFGTTVPVLTPLYNAECEAWQIVDEGEFDCGNSDHCQLPLRLDGVEKQHCSLLFRSGALRIRRNNGRIWVNDLPVSSECALAPGDILNIGPVSFEVSETAHRRQPTAVVSMHPPVQETRLPSSENPVLSRQTIEERLALLNAQQAAAEEQEDSIRALKQDLQRQSDDAERRLQKFRDLEFSLTHQIEQSAAVRIELDQRTAALKEREYELDERNLLSARLRQDAEAQRTELSRHKDSLNAQSLLLSQRSEELDACSAELAAQKQTFITAQSRGNQETHSVERLAAIALEREGLLRARQEAFQAKAEANAAHAALATQESSLRTWQAEIDSRHAELASRVNTIKSLLKERTVTASAASSRQTAAEIVQRNELSHVLRVTEEQRDAAAAERDALLTAVRELQDALQCAQTDAEASPRLHELSQVLRVTEGQRDAAAAERDALLTAVRELQNALQCARSDVEEASRLRAESARQEQTLSGLYQTIEARCSDLQLSESQRQLTLKEMKDLQSQVTQLTDEREKLTRRIAALETSPDSSGEDETELQLIRQIESLRSELNLSASGDSTRQSQFQVTLAERDRSILDLQTEVESLRQQLEAKAAGDPASDMGELDPLLQRLEKADELLRDRDELIRELRSRLLEKEQHSPAEEIDSERCQQEARELDRRAFLLDQRDEELRERTRRIDQSEEEIELQRRQLLDARQQLELARAEIQVAMKHHSAAPADSALPPIAAKSLSARNAAGRPGQADVSDHSVATHDSAVTDSPKAGGTEAAHDLRLELAGLFGLKKPSVASVPDPAIPAAEFIDLSEPAGKVKSVAFRFDEDASSIIENSPASSEAKSSSESNHEQNSDDAVRAYMEQLLSRSRKSAGNALPSELNPAEAPEKVAVPTPKTTPPKITVPKPSEEAPSQKAPLKVKSFIEQYMAGGFGDLTEDGSFTAQHESEYHAKPEAAAIETESAEPRQPRAKIDLQKMRENMNSFRTLSTQSVENALVDHAIRKERHNISGRILFAVILVAMSLFLAIANAKGIIHHPSLTWVTVVSAIGASTELLRKLYGLRARCKEILAPGEQAAESDVQDADETGGRITRRSLTQLVESDDAKSPAADASAAQRHLASSVDHGMSIANNEDDEPEYYEH